MVLVYLNGRRTGIITTGLMGFLFVSTLAQVVGLLDNSSEWSSSNTGSMEVTD